MIASCLWATTASSATLERLLMPGPVVQAHAKLACERCHVEAPDKVRLPTDCADCHRRDDVHQGRFGRDCERCHDAQSFKRPRVRQ